jgi:hypothetical protein
MPSFAASSMTVVGPSRCQVVDDILSNCQLPTAPLYAPVWELEDVPRKSVVSVSQSGDCSTRYPVRILLKSSSSAGEEINVFGQSPRVLRFERGGSFKRVTLQDASNWTGRAYFPKSCRIALKIVLDAPDTGTYAQQLQDSLPVISENMIKAKMDIYSEQSDRASLACLIKANDNDDHADIIDELKDRYYYLHGEEYNPNTYDCTSVDLSDFSAIDCPASSNTRLCRAYRAYKTNQEWLTKHDKNLVHIIERLSGQIDEEDLELLNKWSARLEQEQ